jgi:predicted nucleic acid-binding protein
MPAHGLFEITCSLKRLSEKDRKYVHPVILGKTQYPIEAIHIDSEFIAKYSQVNVPYTKAGDHLFLVVAKHNNYPLVTRDKGLSARAKEANVAVYTPTEYLAELDFNVKIK